MAEIRLMIGKIAELKVAELTSDEKRLFDSDFRVLTDHLALIDPELGRAMEAEKAFYAHAATVAKGYFDQKPFGGLRPSSGQYGMRLFKPQDTGVINWTTTPPVSTVHTWVKTITLPANVCWVDLFGTAIAPVKPETRAETRSVHAFHALISYRPGTRLVSYLWNINRLPYSDVSVELYAKIEKPHKTYKLIPLPSQVLVHPGGEYFCRAAFEKADFSAAETIVEEIALFGILFAEFDYLKVELS